MDTKIETCDFCHIRAEYVLCCSTCGGELCAACYNRTSGGRVQFLGKKKLQHLASHTRMLIKTSSEEGNFLVGDRFFLGAKSYISFQYIQKCRTLLHLEYNKDSIISQLVDISPNTDLSTISMIGSTCNAYILTHIHSMETESFLNKNDIINALHEHKEVIACKSSDFGLLLRECLDVLNFPSVQINTALIDIAPLARTFKHILFTLNVSPYNVTSTCNSIHLPGIQIIWCGDFPQCNIDTEETQLTKIRTITRSLRATFPLITKRNNYSFNLTYQQVNGSMI